MKVLWWKWIAPVRDADIVRSCESVHARAPGQKHFPSTNCLTTSDNQHRANDRTYNTTIMSSSSRLAAGLAKSLESTAAPRIARRTFASSSSKTVATQTAPREALRCLRTPQRPANAVPNSTRCQTRSFTQSASRRALKTIDQIKARNRGGVRLPSTATLYRIGGDIPDFEY